MYCLINSWFSQVNSTTFSFLCSILFLCRFCRHCSYSMLNLCVSVNVCIWWRNHSCTAIPASEQMGRTDTCPSTMYSICYRLSCWCESKIKASYMCEIISRPLIVWKSVTSLGVIQCSWNVFDSINRLLAKFNPILLLKCLMKIINFRR